MTTPAKARSCDHAGCHAAATVRCRFGDGIIDRGAHAGRKQTYVYYCDECLQTVAQLFRLCDLQTVAQLFRLCDIS